MDLDGRDVLKEVQSAIGTEETPKAKEPVLCFGDVGQAVTVLDPKGKARFEDATVDVVGQGLSISEGAKVEIVEVHGDKIVVREI